MPETRELRSVVEAAEQAAAAGDYASAEQLLREAALLQEANLGPLHPDLANTLNNLGVVCDIADKPADAELCYRRAYAIATAVLEPDHPFVATSGKNLRDFCEARGKPVESPTTPPIVAAERERGATSSVHLPPERPSRAESRLPGFRRSSLPLAIGALSASGLVLVMFVATRPWFGPNGRAGSSPGSATQSLPGNPAPGMGARADAIPDATATTSAARQARDGAIVPSTAAESRATATSAPALPLVADAHLCRTLSIGEPRGSPSDWQCDPASLPASQGSLFFYTRLKSENDTTVQHRWYRGDRLQQVVELRIRANPESGYRTYSRSTVDNRSGGDWRVELRTKDGILLHEERFAVR
ncbi:MAG: DUF2914 domain-containing protein [Vicinamibacterales bacterium]